MERHADSTKGKRMASGLIARERPMSPPERCTRSRRSAAKPATASTRTMMLNCFHHTVERTGPNDASPRATTPNQSGDSTFRSLRTTIAIVTTIKATFKPVRRRLAVVRPKLGTSRPSRLRALVYPSKRSNFRDVRCPTQSRQRNRPGRSRRFWSPRTPAKTTGRRRQTPQERRESCRGASSLF